MRTSLAAYRRFEARLAVGRAIVTSLIAGLAIIALTSLLIPRMPAGALELLERTMALRGMREIVLVNDYLAIYMVLFFAGVAELLRVCVQPREEAMLELLLSKPITRSQFLLARSMPVFAAIAVLGVLLAVACGVAAGLHPREGGRATVIGAVAAGLVITAVVILLLAIINTVFVRARDTFQALLISFGVWMAPLAAISVQIYRPDVFTGRPLVQALLVTPPNLLWFDNRMPALAAVASVIAALGTLALVRAAALVLERSELR